MSKEPISPARLSDDQLLHEVQRLAGSERASTTQLIAALAEVDARRLYLSQGYASLFAYCTRVLRLSEHEAYGRIEAARASRRFPILLPMLERGELTLTSITLLRPHLDAANHLGVLAQARWRSKREVEDIIAALRPQPDAPSLLRKVREVSVAAVPTVADQDRALSQAAMDLPATAFPAGSSTDSAAEPSPALECPSSAARSNPTRPSVKPLAPERYQLQVTISGDAQRKLRRAQDLMRHSVPSGDLAPIIERAIDLLLKDLERTRVAAVARPRAAKAATLGSRHIPAVVRRAVWRRDQGQCAFAGAGRRCEETAFLEFHHVRPFEAGGEPTVENIELRCRAHNQYEADLFIGEEFIVRERRGSYSVRTGLARH
jgi:hypothetical protein